MSNNVKPKHKHNPAPRHYTDSPFNTSICSSCSDAESDYNLQLTNCCLPKKDKDMFITGRTGEDHTASYFHMSLFFLMINYTEYT